MRKVSGPRPTLADLEAPPKPIPPEEREEALRFLEQKLAEFAARPEEAGVAEEEILEEIRQVRLARCR